MNELSGSGWLYVQSPWLFGKPEITPKTHSDPGDNDGECLGTNEPPMT